MALESTWTCFSSILHSSLVTGKCLESLRLVLDDHQWKHNWTEMVQNVFIFSKYCVVLPFDQNFNVIHWYMYLLNNDMNLKQSDWH